MGVSENPYARGRRERQLRSPGVGQPDDRGRVEAHPDREAVREVLEHRFGGDHCRAVFGRNSGGEAALRDEVLPELLGLDTLSAAATGLRRMGAVYAGQNPVILALPRGGVPVAAEVAAALSAPLGLVLVRKIGVPWRPELAMGAVVDGATPIIVRNEDVIRHLAIDEAEFKQVCDEELAEIESRRRRYLGDRPPIDVKGRVTIVVDDGIATGATIRAALRATRMRTPKTLVLAVPVASTEALAEVGEEADDVICLEDHEFLGAIGFYYSDFRQTSDQEVIAAIARYSSHAKVG